jgi:hypothetical protein
MCLALQGRLAIAVPVHAWRPPTRGIHGESTEIAIVSFLQHDSRHQSLGWRWRLMEGRWMPGVVEAYDVYLCPSPRGRVCVALTCGVAPDKGGRTIGGLAEGMDDVRLYHVQQYRRRRGGLG